MDTYIYGYSDTPQKHHLTLMLRCNGIAYEFVDPSDVDVGYEDAVCIRIPRPQYKWQRKVLDRLGRAMNNHNENTWFPLCTNTPIEIYRR